MIDIVILGAGGLAKEVYSWMEENKRFNIIAFYEESWMTKEIFGIPVVNDLKDYANCDFFCAVGTPSLRKRLIEIAYNSGLLEAPAFVHSSAFIGKNTSIESGTIVSPNCTITVDIHLHKNVLVNMNTTIGHDCIINENVVINPGCNISGNVTIKSDTLIGTNSAVRQKINIGNDVIVGMGSNVIKDVESGYTVMGNPAKVKINI